MSPFAMLFRSRRTCIVLSVFTLAVCALATAPVQAQVPYKIIDTWKVGGTGGWDYLLADPTLGVLYVTHGPRVEILDLKTGKPVGALTGLKGTHGIALDREGRYGYISDGGSNDVLVFDRHNYKTVTTIATGTNPDGIVFEPVTKTVWAFNGRSSSVSVIDAATAKVVATIELPGKPEFPAVDGKGNVYDNIENKNEIVRLDARAKTLTASWPLANCESPSGLAIDDAHARLFSVCDGNAMAIVDATTGKRIATAKIGDGPDAAAYSANRELAFSSNGDGTLSVVDTRHGFRTIESLPTQKGGRTMAYDAGTDRVFVVSAQFNPPPAPTAQVPHPRPTVIPDSFVVLVIGRK